MLLALAGTVAAQNAAIYGRVTDATGDALPGALVTAEHQRTGLVRSVTTDSTGQYRLFSLPVGAYVIRFELAGFKTVNREGLQLQVGQEAVVNVTLDLAPVEETVTVTAETAMVEVRKSEVATNISEGQIETLPMKTRQWIDLATLAPGTGQDAIRAVFYNSVNIGAGINFYSNGFYVDGVSNNWQQQGEPRQDFPQDGIAEFRVHGSNARAEFGYAQGGYLNVVTKSGGNEIRGSAFEYFRNKALNSRTVLQQVKPDYKRHQYGGSIGGPIVKDKSHFFTSFEYTDETQFFTVNTRGVFPQEEGTFEQPNWNYMVLARIDHIFNDQHRFFARFARQNNELTFRGAGGINGRTASFGFGAPRNAIVFGETWFIRPETLNELKVQWAKATFIGWPTGGPKWTTTGEFPAERVDLPPIIRRPSLVTGNESAFLGPERHFQIKDDFAHYFGEHELKFGASLVWVDWEPDNVGISPTFTFATDAPFDPANRATYPILFTQRLLPRFDDFESTEHSLYIEDTWTLTPSFTLNLGLRYDWQTGVWNEDLLDLEVPEIRVRDQLLRPRGRQDPSLFPFFDGSTRGDKNNFGPRLGFVLNPGGTGQQTIHAAYGLFYNRYRANGSPRAERNPRDLQVIISNPSFPDPYQGRDPFAVATAQRNFETQANDARNPYAHQYSLGYSRQIDANFSISVDGVFADGFNQHTQLDRNYFATPADRAAGRRPFSQYGRVTEGRTDGNLRYRAFVLKFQRRLANRWQLLTSYTLASAKNDSELLPADQFDPAADFGYAEADRRHRLTVSGLVELPAKFAASGILRYQSSLPFNVTAGRDLNGDGLATDRPAGVTRNSGCRDLDLAAVNAYRVANRLAPVADVSCPDFLTIDLVLNRTFDLGRAQSIEAIFQVFNLFNRSNYFPPNGNALSASFGQSLQVADPRQIELAVRFRF